MNNKNKPCEMCGNNRWRTITKVGATRKYRCRNPKCDAIRSIGFIKELGKEGQTIEYGAGTL